MLKIQLQSNASLERSVEALSNAFTRFIEASSKAGYARVYAYPHPDPVIAGMFVFKRLLAAGVRPHYSVTPKPPPPDSPLMALGYDSVNYKAGEVSDVVLMISSGDVKGTPPMNVYVFHGEGSVSAMAALAVITSTGYRGSWDPLIALAGSYYGRFHSKSGKFYGIDRIVVEELVKVDHYGLETVTGLKVYKPTIGDLCEQMARTSHPYYPGFTGDEAYCRDFFRAQGFEEALTTGMAGITGRERVERLIEIVLEAIREKGAVSGLDSLVEEYVGGYLVSRQPVNPIKDLRMAGDTLLYSGETGGLEAMLAAAIDMENEYQIAERALEDYSRLIGESMGKAKPRRSRLKAKYKLYIIDAGPSDSLTFLWKALSVAGKIERDSLVAVESEDGELILSPFQAELSSGYGTVKRLIEARVATLEGTRLWVSVDALR